MRGVVRFPSNWGYMRAKYLFKRMERPAGESDQIVTSFRDGVVTARANRRTDGFTESLKEIGYQGVRKGDLVIHAMDGFAGAIGVSDSDGKCTPVYSVCVPILNNADTRYYAYLLRAFALNGFVGSLSRGIRERSTEFRFREFASLYLPLPSLLDQREIADFLDREIARIDDLIAKNRRFLELIEERSTSEVVSVLTGQTRNPSKVSGTEWIGSVPASWEVLPIARITHLAETGPFGSQLHAGDYVPGGVPVINPVHLREGKITPDEDNAVSTETAARLRRHQLAEGDLVLARRGEVGRCAIVSPREVGWLCGTGSMKLRLKPGHDPQYFNLLMATPGPQEQLLLHSVGSTMPNINPTIMSRLVVPVPPQNDQTAIVNEVAEIKKTARQLKQKIESAIERLGEYRSALISAAVTGEIDVRSYRPQEAAAVCQ